MTLLTSIDQSYMTTARYSCSQTALYLASKKVMKALHFHIDQFAQFKSRYNSAYISLLNDSILNAEQAPSYLQLLKQSENNYQHLNKLCADCTADWQKLKRYIFAAYPKAEHKHQLTEAGQHYYKKAIAKNWNGANALFMAAKHFISTHLQALSDGQNMPAHFPEEFNQHYIQFSKGLLNFRQSEREIKSGTALKITVNNALFQIISEVCQDGQQIFRNNADVKKQFVFQLLSHQESEIITQNLRHTDAAFPPESEQHFNTEGHHFNN